MNRILATFNPQVVVDGRCESADDERGRPEFDVTDEILALGKDAALALRDDTDATFALKGSPSAPAWVREWEGPFYISVEDAIFDFFDE